MTRRVIGGDPLVAHRSEVRRTPAAPGGHFRGYNRGQYKANRNAERKEKHWYSPSIRNAYLRLSLSSAEPFRIFTGRIEGRGWSGVEIRQSL